MCLIVRLATGVAVSHKSKGASGVNQWPQESEKSYTTTKHGQKYRPP